MFYVKNYGGNIMDTDKESLEPHRKLKFRRGAPSKCVCPQCHYKIKKKRGLPCMTMKCPNCGVSLVGNK